MFDYAVINKSSLAGADALAAKIVAAEQKLSPTYCNAWNLGGCMGEVVKDESAANGCDMLFVLQDDDPNVQGAFGYHDEQNGVPYARILTATILGAGGGQTDGGSIGVSIISVALHELWESIIDKFVDDLVLMPSGIFVFKEAADPVQQNNIPVQLDDGSTVLASDGVLPRYFDGEAPSDGSEPLSLSALIGGAGPGAPFAIMPGGYQSQFDPSKVSDPNGPIVTVWGAEVPAAVKVAKVAGGRLKDKVERYIKHLGHATGRDYVWQHREQAA